MSIFSLPDTFSPACLQFSLGRPLLRLPFGLRSQTVRVTDRQTMTCNILIIIIITLGSVSLTEPQVISDQYTYFSNPQLLKSTHSRKGRVSCLGEGKIARREVDPIVLLCFDRSWEIWALTPYPLPRLYRLYLLHKFYISTDSDLTQKTASDSCSKL